MQSSRKRKSRMETDKISKWGASQRRTGKLSGASSQARRTLPATRSDLVITEAELTSKLLEDLTGVGWSP